MFSVVQGVWTFSMIGLFEPQQVHPIQSYTIQSTSESQNGDDRFDDSFIAYFTGYIVHLTSGVEGGGAHFLLALVI